MAREKIRYITEKRGTRRSTDAFGIQECSSMTGGPTSTRTSIVLGNFAATRIYEPSENRSVPAVRLLR